MSYQQAVDNPEYKEQRVRIDVNQQISQEQREQFITSGRTAMFRKGVSLPTKYLLENDLLKPQSRVLIYGGGKAVHDPVALRAAGHIVLEHDYVYSPAPDLLAKTFDVVIANYVVNTLPPESRDFVYRQIAASTAIDGVAYIAARSDKLKGKTTPHQDGCITSIGTFQRIYLKYNDGNGELCDEAERHFGDVAMLKTNAVLSFVACRHQV